MNHRFTKFRSTSPGRARRERRPVMGPFAVAVVVCLAMAACGSSPAGDSANAATPGALDVVVTTSIWGSVVREAFGDSINVNVLIPNDADAHHFSPSTRQAAELENADLIVMNGAGLEAGVQTIIDAVRESGTPVFVIVDHVATIPIGDEPAALRGAETSTAPDDDHGTVDPHVWFDPSLVAQAVTALATDLDARGVSDAGERAAAYNRSLDELDASLAKQVETIPADRRVLVTNHESFQYYANRYGLTVVATIVGSITTDAQPSVAELEDVVDVISEYDVPAIFVESAQSTKLATSLADEAGRDVAVVELLTEGLGDTGDYPSFMREDTTRIVDALSAP